jgi:serine/threonine protein kinase
MTTVTDSLLGTFIGNYRLTSVLGEGGMGRVYLAEHPGIGSRVAIKVLSEECTRHPELLDRFFAEARAVNLIRHENIVSVLDLAVLPDGRPFIVMEFIDGHTLAHHVRNTHAPLGGVMQVIGEVLAGLSAAHAIGIVHRDLKPDNVMVTVEGHAKILDFGIAKLAPGLRADVSPRTKTGALLGTPAYMAPEQITGSGHIDPRTDVYAMGVVLYEAVTGSTPFAGGTLFDLMRAHMEQPVPPPHDLRADLPPQIEHVILQALAKQPEQRFQSVSAMAQALAHAASVLPAAQWKPLSTRGGPRIAVSGNRPIPSDLRPTPSDVRPTRDDRAVLGHQPTLQQPTPPDFKSTAVDAKTQVQHRRIGLIIAILVAATVGIGITLLAISRSASSEQPPAVAETSPAPSPASPAADPIPDPLPSPAVADAGVVARSVGTTTKPKPPAPPAVQPKPNQPIIVGGGSAADHGVHIGSNVQIGGNVIIGSNTPAVAPTTPASTAPASTAPAKTKISKPADYNAKRFDPVTYLPKAQALAQQLIVDAKLTNFEFDPVFPDGHVDLTMDGRDREYNFRSPSKSARPPNVPRNLPVERACMVHVEVGAREITATIRTTDDCDDKLVRAPKCSLASVWKQAMTAGTPKDLVARIGWLFDEQWFFDIDFEGKGGGVSSFADRCP